MDQGITFVLFAAREAFQKSLGFSPAKLVIGHTPRGPLKALKENLFIPEESSKTSVQNFREGLSWATL